MDTENAGWVDRLKRKVAYQLGVDRRTDFYDLAALTPDCRTARSEVVQFYSGVPNIGNYLPVLGIRNVLGRETDLWNAHDDEIDWAFVNQNYSWAIIGGAGLLHADFESFWEQVAAYCRLPIVIWGVGACFPDAEDSPGVATSTARPVLKEALLVNLRDDVTAAHYGVESAHISPCPTVAYLEDWMTGKKEREGPVLHSSHTGLVDEEEQTVLHEVVEVSSEAVEYTDNIERRLDGLEDIVDRYAQSDLVVTTRLHGAIIAYALRTPYIAVPRDDKVRAFQRLYGNGILAESPEELRRLLEGPLEIEVGAVDRESVYQFGRRVKERMSSMQNRSAM